MNYFKPTSTKAIFSLSLAISLPVFWFLVMIMSIPYCLQGFPDGFLPFPCHYLAFSFTYLFVIFLLGLIYPLLYLIARLINKGKKPKKKYKKKGIVKEKII